MRDLTTEELGHVYGAGQGSGKNEYNNKNSKQHASKQSKYSKQYASKQSKHSNNYRNNYYG